MKKCKFLTFALAVLIGAACGVGLASKSLAAPAYTAGHEQALAPDAGEPQAANGFSQAAEQQSVDLRTRPFLYWRMWANRKIPYVPAFLFCLLTSAAAWWLLPATMVAAKENCRTGFWRTLLAGALTVVLAAVFARFLFRSEIGFPLAALILALLELGLVLGIAVSAGLVGESVVVKLGLSSKLSLSDHPTARRLLQLTVGAALICLILLIPGISGLPRIGARLVMLIAFLGCGGIIRARLTHRKLD